MPHRFIQARPGFEANSVEVQLHVDVRMRPKAGTQTTKIKSAKSFVEVHPRKFIPSKYTRYTVLDTGNILFLSCVHAHAVQIQYTNGGDQSIIYSEK